MRKTEIAYKVERIKMITGKTIGTRIRQARGYKTQEELTKITGISIASIKNWERDKGEPALKYIRLIAEKLKVSPILLAFGNNSKIPEEKQIILMNQIMSLPKNDKETITKIIEGLIISNLIKKQEIETSHNTD